MQRSVGAGVIVAILAAMLWSPHIAVLRTLHAEGAPVMTLLFHGLFWSTLGCLLLLFLSGRASELSMFNRRQTELIVLAVMGGYGFWLLRGLAMGGSDAPRGELLAYTAPFFMVAFSFFGAERPGGRALLGLVVGFIGCLLLARGIGVPGQTGGPSRVLGLASAACWGLFFVAARPLMREEKTLPAVTIVMAIGTACMLITCLSTGEPVLAVRSSSFSSTVLWGVFTMGFMTALWLKSLATLPAAQVAPFWYFGLVFSAFWAHRAGQSVGWWWVLLGSTLVVIGAYSALGRRQRRTVSMGDIIRGS